MKMSSKGKQGTKKKLAQADANDLRVDNAVDLLGEVIAGLEYDLRVLKSQLASGREQLKVARSAMRLLQGVKPQGAR